MGLELRSSTQTNSPVAIAAVANRPRISAEAQP